MALATPAGQRATEFVALAMTGVTPEKSRAGKEMKLPPPATELSAPATAAATKRRRKVRRGSGNGGNSLETPSVVRGDPHVRRIGQRFQAGQKPSRRADRGQP